MKKDTSFHDFIVYDLLATIPAVTSRAMMGGWIIYAEGKTIALISENQLYLKAEGEQAALLMSLGWKKFTYVKKTGVAVTMKYYLVPEELIDNQEAFNEILVKVLGE